MKIHSENEWSSLKEVIVGNVFDDMSFNVDMSFKLFFQDSAQWGYTIGAKHKVPIRQKLIDELTEDINGFVETLENEGVNVHRPRVLSKVVKIKTEHWETELFPALNVRDQSIIFGETILETPPMQRNRYFENELLKDIYYNAYQDGAKWIQMPKASLSDLSLKMNNEMMIDGAQFVRFGKNIIVNISNNSHKLALDWIINEFPQYNFHVIKSLVDNHLDSYIVPLCEGVLLLRDKEFLKQIPQFLKDWKIIYPPKPSKNQFPEYEKEDPILTSAFIDMNVLSIDGNKIICNSLFPELAELLYEEGFDPIPVQHRHRRIFAGGFHCFTLDLLRIT